ncbi:putative transcription factor C2H2 family [Helianthus annuus]|nr:putative transcription factor C2H2 family [Helianthus annuus]KAJ0542858.1 putative transcription factor C2H2 family [Helianthus annuus]KAJ0707914.1 putative transcription factor DDT family [Helianthus annuus]
MAIAATASPNSKPTLSTPKKKTTTTTVTTTGDEEKQITSEMKSNNQSSKPQKRNTNPGVRVIHGKIYDSQNGTTCHQCRQKTYAVYVNCKNQAKAKPCNIKYCRTCLLNRYGEKVEEVELLEKWDCPKCKGVCNCSICMKKRGHQPTGMVVQMAKASGFTSVSDMIVAKGAQNVSNYKRVKETTASPRKLASPAEGIVTKSPKKPGKENLFDGKTDLNANPIVSAPSPVEKKPKKVKRKGLEVKPDDIGVNNVTETETTNTLNEKNHKKLKSNGSTEIVEGNAVEKKPKNVKRKGPEVKPDGSVVNDVSETEINHAINEKKQKKLKTDGSKKTVDGNEVKESNISHDQHANQHSEDNQCLVKKKTSNFFESVIPLPAGTELVTVAGVDLSKEDAGNALQFLEFCSTFAKILDVKKGQAEAVLRDLIKGRSTRRGKFTSVIQFHIQLLSVIQEELESDSESPTPDPSHGNDSWLKALKSCISDSNVKHMDSIDLTAAGYDNLESSMKLKLLVFLCDEVLGTEKIRNWIDDQNVKFAEKRKEAKEKLSVAKDKEKTIKQKMQDDIAKAIIAKEGVPLTLSEHDAIVSKIKNKAAEAHAEMLACKDMVPIDKSRPDAVRAEPIFRDNSGHMYWRLKGCSENPGILLQDIGTGDHTVEVVDKWFEFDDEQMDLIEKHINVLRTRFRKHYKN